VTGPPAWLRRLRRNLAMPFPWPARRARHAAIASARKQKERSQAGAADADAVRLQIEALRERNHFAALIAQDIIRRHTGGQRGN
jgi:hypothetical protein